MKIIVDAMGGDKAPHEIVKGCIDSVKAEEGFEVILVGFENEIRKELLKYQYDSSRIIIHNTDEIITNTDIPLKALKKKKNSSMVVGINLLKEGKGDAFISAGNSGALMAGGLLIVGRIKGVDRPALAALIPTATSKALLIDAGSNSECKPLNLLQFGIIGSVYMKNVFNIENPAVGLVNIGSEEKKGNEVYRQAYELLLASRLNFAGNIEGRDIPEGKVDVVVCDGFVGNVVLKFMEGMAKNMFGLLKQEFTRNIFTKIGTMLLMSGLKNFKRKTDYTEYGGAPLLGIDGIVMKCHGSSNAKAISVAISQAVAFIKSRAIQQMRDDFLNMEVEEIDTNRKKRRNFRIGKLFTRKNTDKL